MDKKIRILTIDDDAEILELLRVTLEAEGYEVISADDGIKGLMTARMQKPDCIILDLIMPELDGYKVCRLLKSDKKFSMIPILMLTGMAEERDKIMGLKSETDDYLTKPFDPAEVVAKVKELLSKKEGKNI